MSEPPHIPCGPSPADLKVLQSTTAADFDGHTEFQRLSPRQRLAWLDEAVAFITAAKSSRRVTSFAPELSTNDWNAIQRDAAGVVSRIESMRPGEFAQYQVAPE